MKLALLGDIHIHDYAAAPWRLLNKRLLGWVNGICNRHRRFDERLFVETLKQIAALKPDWLLCSGDVTTLSLDSEFARAMELMDQAVASIPTVMVPGNHDRYTAGAARGRMFERWVGARGPGKFPALMPLEKKQSQKLDDSSRAGYWHVLALDSAWPRFWDSTGRIGEVQLAQAEELLKSLSSQDGVIVLCHYPSWIPQQVKVKDQHRLIDAPAFRQILQACSARVIYLHGHVHHPWIYHVGHQTEVMYDVLKSSDNHHDENKSRNGLVSTVPVEPWQAGDILSINAGSPTQTGSRQIMGQGFWSIQLPDKPAQGLVELNHHRCFAEENGGIRWCEQVWLIGKNEV